MAKSKTASKFFTLTLCLLAIIFIVVFVCNKKVATAQDQAYLKVDYLTGNYIEFGEIVSISASQDKIFTVEIIDDGLFLRITPDNKLVKLENTSEENYKNAQVLAFSDKAFVKQDNGIYRYDLGDDKLVKYVDLTYNYNILDTVVQGKFKSFGNAYNDQLLIVDYTSIIVLFSVNVDPYLPTDSKRVDFIVTNSSKSFDKMVIENTVNNSFTMHLYDSGIGSKFTINCTKNQETNKYTYQEGNVNGLQVFENADLFTYFAGGLHLEQDGLYKTHERAIKISTEEECNSSDEYIQQFSKMASNGDYLFVVDNPQKAVKVYDKNFELYALYGSIGDGISNNERGLTRFRAPKLLTYNTDYFALFDEGNSRILLLNENLEVLTTCHATDISNLLIFNGIWYTSNKTLFKLDENLEYLGEVAADSNIISLTTDQNSVFISTENGVYKVKGDKLEQVNNFTPKHIVGGRHDGVTYSLDNGITMYKDTKQIVSLDIDNIDFFQADYAGNVLAGSGNTLYELKRNLQGFEKTTYTTNLAISDIVITKNGEILGLSGNGIVKINYTGVISSELTFDIPQIEQPVKAIQLEESTYGYLCPDNYESIVEVPSASYILFAHATYSNNQYYYTELLKDGKYIKLFLPANSEHTVVLDSSNPPYEYIKYGGTDQEPRVYEYPSHSSSPISNIKIERDRSYKVIRQVATTWLWYELEIDGIRCYVNAINYIQAEPPYKTVERYYLRAKSDFLGDQVIIYKEADENSEIIDKVGEGTLLELTEPYNENSEFLQIRYNKGIAYVKTKNIQKDGLTEGQKFALVFAGIVIGLTAVCGVLSLLARRRKSEQ